MKNLNKKPPLNLVSERSQRIKEVGFYWFSELDAEI